uniref:Uncharacterized protein n=1 Tax=Rhizophora mucronata TaxID=61149 RepID=A0A2P2IVM7_RHIMU
MGLPKVLFLFGS